MFYTAVFGVEPLEAAYKSFVISPPRTAEFDSVKGTVDCPYGKIDIDFSRGKDGEVSLNLTVPMSTTAIVKLPGISKSVRVLREGGQERTETGKTLTLSHGRFSVIVPPKSNDLVKIFFYLYISFSSNYTHFPS